MPSTLTDFDDTPVEETAPEGPGQDITLEDLGEDKELNTPPANLLSTPTPTKKHKPT